MSKVIIIVGVLLVIFGGYLFYQYGSKMTTKMKTNGSQATIGTHTFDVEVVKTNNNTQIALTKYTAIADNQGMLFLFDQPGFYTFWMKNMKFPIDMIFIHDDVVVSFVENATPPTSKDTQPLIYQPESSANKVLEVNKGTIKRDNIKKGDKVKIVIK